MQMGFTIQEEKSGRWYFTRSIFNTAKDARIELTRVQSEKPDAHFRLVRITNIKVLKVK